MLKSFICNVMGHRIDRRRVWNDGIDFRTTCPRCGTEMVRDLTGWREFDEARDADEGRVPHHRG